MNEKIITDISLEMGFCAAKIIDTDKIVFDFGFRKYCEENRCGNYRFNYSCPPACGSPERLKEEVLYYKNALVLRSQCKIEDFSQSDIIEDAKKLHNGTMLKLKEKLTEMGCTGKILGAGPCTLCTPCNMSRGMPCKHPDSRYSCLSAYCINVLDLAEKCGMEYTYKDGILYFFGVYLF